MSYEKSLLDKIDRDIVDLLRRDARLSYRELGEKVFLSANTVAERIRRLVHHGVLQAFCAKVDLAALGLPLQALVDVKMARETSAAGFEKAIAAIPGIQEATLMTGSYDYMLRVACRDQADLVRLMEALRERAGVQDTTSRVILRQVDVHAQRAQAQGG